MRKIVVALIVLLALTGLLLVFAEQLGLPAPRINLVALAHIWLGLFFSVLFPLYGWDHVKANRHWLRAVSLVTFSGATQAVAGTVLLLSGVLLLLYDVEVWPRVRVLHHGLTYLLGASLTLHFLSPKGTGRTHGG